MNNEALLLGQDVWNYQRTNEEKLKNAYLTKNEFVELVTTRERDVCRITIGRSRNDAFIT